MVFNEVCVKGNRLLLLLSIFFLCFSNINCAPVGFSKDEKSQEPQGYLESASTYELDQAKFGIDEILDSKDIIVIKSKYRNRCLSFEYDDQVQSVSVLLKDCQFDSTQLIVREGSFFRFNNTDLYLSLDVGDKFSNNSSFELIDSQLVHLHSGLCLTIGDSGSVSFESCSDNKSQDFTIIKI